MAGRNPRWQRPLSRVGPVPDANRLLQDRQRQGARDVGAQSVNGFHVGAMMITSDVSCRLLEVDFSPWQRVTKFDPRSAALADRHYNRRKVGSPQFMPPGQTVILLSANERAVFGWWRPDPASGLKAMNGYDGWTCTIFRNEGAGLSSVGILAAERFLIDLGVTCGPDGLLTYVDRRKVKSTNPGCCFKKAGWRKIGVSADKRKDLLQKAWTEAGR